MKMKKVLALCLVFSFIVFGTINVNAQEFIYGSYYLDDGKEGADDDIYWTPENQGEIVSVLDGGEWVWDEYTRGRTFIYDTTNKSIALDTGLFSIFNEMEYIDGIYSEKIDGEMYNVALEGTKVNSGTFWGKFSAWANLFFGDGLKDAFINYVKTYDFSNLTEYYNKYNKLPDVIVECEYISSMTPNVNFSAMLVQMSMPLGTYNPTINTTNIFDLKSEVIYYIDDFSTPNAYNEKAFDAVTCRYFAPNGNVNLNVCHSFDDELSNLKTLYNNFGKGSNEYENAKQTLIDKCNNFTGTAGTSIKDSNGNSTELSCYSSCKYLSNRISEIEGSYQDDYRCGAIGTKLASWIMRILKIIRYIVPVLVIILSVLDYIGAISSNNDDAMKKASQKFTKRIIATVVLFLLPVILQFLFDIFKIPGLESSNPFCMK